MNPARCDELDYIHFLVAAQTHFTCTEAARCQPAQAPAQAPAPAHDAFTRLLQRQPPDTAARWQEVQGVVRPEAGVLVLDDTTLDKPYATKMALVTRHWSGKHHAVVQGINLLTLLWTDGDALIPCDCRIYDKPWGGQTKNAHFRALVATAHARGFAPAGVLFDSWYASLENLKTVREYGWHWLTRLKRNRLVHPDGHGNVPVSTLTCPPEGRVVHLKGYGFMRLFQTVAPDGDVEHWATDDLQMPPAERERLALQGWGVESYHRGLKQYCGIEKAQVRHATAQRGHILLALRAFLRLELHRLRTGISWYEAKLAIIRDAVRAYLAQPRYLLRSTA